MLSEPMLTCRFCRSEDLISAPCITILATAKDVLKSD